MSKREAKRPVHATLPAEMAAWLDVEAARDMDTVSGVLRRHLLPAMRRESGSHLALAVVDWDKLRAWLDAAQTLLNANAIALVSGGKPPSRDERLRQSEEAEDLVHDAAELLDKVADDPNRTVRAIKAGRKIAIERAARTPAARLN